MSRNKVEDGRLVRPRPRSHKGAQPLGYRNDATIIHEGYVLGFDFNVIQRYQEIQMVGQPRPGRVPAGTDLHITINAPGFVILLELTRVGGLQMGQVQAQLFTRLADVMHRKLEPDAHNIGMLPELASETVKKWFEENGVTLQHMGHNVRTL